MLRNKIARKQFSDTIYSIDWTQNACVERSAAFDFWKEVSKQPCMLTLKQISHPLAELQSFIVTAYCCWARSWILLLLYEGKNVALVNVRFKQCAIKAITLCALLSPHLHIALTLGLYQSGLYYSGNNYIGTQGYTHADAYDHEFYLVRIPRGLTYDIHKHVFYIQSQKKTPF